MRLSNLFMSTIIVLAAVMCSTPDLDAQGQGQGGRQGRAGQGQGQGQGRGAQGRGQQGRGGAFGSTRGGGTTTLLGLCQNASVQKEIDLVDEQKADLTKLRTSQDEGGVMQRVARGLVTFGGNCGAESDDSACRQWASWVAPVAHAPKLDPYVGSIKGIGPALFAYHRLLSGADTLKPDVQTRKMLNALGFDVPEGPNALLLVAEAAADELDTSMAVLDQLLWWDTQPE